MSDKFPEGIDRRPSDNMYFEIDDPTSQTEQLLPINEASITAVFLQQAAELFVDGQFVDLIRLYKIVDNYKEIMPADDYDDFLKGLKTSKIAFEIELYEILRNDADTLSPDE